MYFVEVFASRRVDAARGSPVGLHEPQVDRDARRRRDVQGRDPAAARRRRPAVGSRGGGGGADRDVRAGAVREHEAVRAHAVDARQQQRRRQRVAAHVRARRGKQHARRTRDVRVAYARRTAERGPDNCLLT